MTENNVGKDRKAFYYLISNAVYSKTTENLKYKVDVKGWQTTEKTF